MMHLVRFLGDSISVSKHRSLSLVICKLLTSEPKGPCTSVHHSVRWELKQESKMADNDLTPNYVPTSIRELPTFFVLQSGRRSVAEPAGLQLAAKAAGVI